MHQQLQQDRAAAEGREAVHADGLEAIFVAALWQLILNYWVPGPQKSPKRTPREPPENSTPKAHLPAQSIQGPLKHLNYF